MDQNPQYTRYHPKWYRTQKPIFWWVRRWADIRFIFRELTSLAVAFYAVILILHYHAVQTGPDAFASLNALFKSRWSILIHVFAWLAVLYHSVTWFNLAPRAIVVQLGKWRVPDVLISGGNYAAWIAISALIVWAYTAG